MDKEINYKTEILIAVKKGFQSNFNSNPEEYYFSPGRMNIIGEHIDYNGGKVLPLAIDLGIYAGVKKSETNEIRVISTMDNEMRTFVVNDLSKTNNYLDYIKAIIYILSTDGHICDNGFDLYLHSTLPPAAGLSSSASLEMLVIHIFNDYFRFGLGGLSLIQYAHRAENEYIQVHCGIMDQFVIGVAEVNKAILLDTNTLQYRYVDFILNDVSILIFNTNKPRDLVSSKYNQRRSECEKALSIMQEKVYRSALVDYSLAEINQLASYLGEVLYRRAKHVVTENIRVGMAIKALEAEDYGALGKLLLQSHESLMIDYEVTGVYLDTIYEILASTDLAYGGRMIGAGFGGCAICLVKNENITKVIDLVMMVYNQKLNHKLSVFVAKSSNKTGKIK